MCVYGGGRVVEALLLYFKFSQSSHAVIFCTAVFVLPVSSHVVISGAFQGPPLKVRRAHNIIRPRLFLLGDPHPHPSPGPSPPQPTSRLPCKSGHRNSFTSQRVHLPAAAPCCLCRYCRSSVPSGGRHR